MPQNANQPLGRIAARTFLFKTKPHSKGQEWGLGTNLWQAYLSPTVTVRFKVQIVVLPRTIAQTVL